MKWIDAAAPASQETGNYRDIQFIRGNVGCLGGTGMRGAGRWTEMDSQSDTATMFSVGLCTYGCFHAGAVGADDCFNETADFHHQSRNTHTDTHTQMRCVRADLRVFGHPVAQHVEDSVSGSAADDEIFIAGPFGVCKNCCENQNHQRGYYQY